MAQAENDSKTFTLGLTMAGAISAGAYTAGVLDVLFEALDRHNARQAKGQAGNWRGELQGLPRHKVVLRVISGTSAGGVSAGLSVAGLVSARRGQATPDGLEIGAKGDGSYTSPSGYAYQYDYILNPLHYVWIEAMDLWREPAKGESFLSSSDLGDGPVISALNSKTIDAGATDALREITWTGAPYRFLSEDFDLFLTTTNLQGVPYKITFSADDNPATHAMAQHATVRHFRVSGLGSAKHSSPWLEAWGDHGIPLVLPTGTEPIDFDADGPGHEWRHFKAAAIATGAFPVGLAPRTIEAEVQDFGPVDGAAASRGGAWPINIDPVGVGADGVARDRRPRAQLGEGMATDAVTYVAVDGGVANNEPFELARYTLRRRSEDGGFLASNPRGAETAHSAVLMVDPFPEGPVYTPLTVEQADALRAIVPAARRLVPALINQARFKPGELLEASSADIFSRFLIAPSRRVSSKDPAAEGEAPVRMGLAGASAIASGAFGGFGGFFDRAFRAHDYMLGRRNMHSFLDQYFKLAASNTVLDLDGPATDRVRVVDAGDDFYAARPPLPTWPRIAQSELDPILDAAQGRIRAVGAAMVGFTGLDWLRQKVLGAVWGGAFWGTVNGVEASVTKALRSIVMAELIQRDQHHDFRSDGQGRPFSDAHRAVLVALANAGAEALPVDLSKRDRRRRLDRGQSTATMLDAIAGPDDTDESRAYALDQLAPVLADLEQRGLIWRAPRISSTDHRYTLRALKPGKVWIEKTRAFVSRLSESLGM